MKLSNLKEAGLNFLVIENQQILDFSGGFKLSWAS